MNDTRISISHRNLDADALQSRYALRVTARLSEQSVLTAHDLGERLRFARERALESARARRAAVPTPSLHVAGGNAAALALGGGPRSSKPWWGRFAAVLPLLVLVAGLAVIQNQLARAQISAAAEIDFDLLADDLPPTAYSDPGFLEFLKAPSN